MSQEPSGLRVLETILQSPGCASSARTPDSTSEATRSRIVAVIVARLTGDMRLAEYFLVARTRRSGAPTHVAKPAGSLTLQHLLDFLQDDVIAAGVRRALTDVSNVYRRRADVFITKSRLAQYIMCQSRRGIPVSAQLAVDMYLELWVQRPRCLVIDKWLRRLMTDSQTRKRFSADFRSEFAIQRGSFPVHRALSQPDARRKARVSNV